MEDEWDCIAVGGGAAGLSAALVLGRARRRTLVVDAGAQSNLAAPGIGGLLGQEGRPPAEFYRTGRAELEASPSVEVRSGEVTAGVASGTGFVLELANGTRARSRKVLLATGMDYRMPNLPGLAGLWGDRPSTARSATAGRCAISRSRYWHGAKSRRTWRSC